MEKKWCAPYLEAINLILNGTPVKKLDEIRQECNKIFLKNVFEGNIEQINGYPPESIVISFVAYAENKILLGEDPMEIYGNFKGLEPVELRQRGRRILENVVKKYLH